MTEKSTPYGRLIVGPKEELFARAVKIAADQGSRVPAAPFSWAFTGGSTPAEWYRWCVATRTIPEDLVARTTFTVSDERHVPLVSDQSNFGNADRELLSPLEVGAEQKAPWSTQLSPLEAAQSYAKTWAARFGAGLAYDVCFLGMGDDAHTASWFPGSPLLKTEIAELFTAIEVPGKGWRLTITPAGLRTCGAVVVMTLGSGKAAALSRVMSGAFDPISAPSQILKTCADRVTWLVDPAAAGGLA